MGPYLLCPTSEFQLQSGATTGAGGTFMANGQVARLTFAFQGSGTISTGVVTIEEAYWKPGQPEFAGTWSTITTISGASLTTGAQQTVHVLGSAWAVRARISTAIAGGGSITGTVWGN